MNQQNSDLPQPAEEPPRWQPLGAIDRRVVGVLVEKAKTTPEGYPLSLNSVCTASNQKSNRSPVMNLQPEDVEESLERLREMGAVGLIEGYGRVSKYRHYLYKWLGVEKVELAVMAELLLRGAQTVGELRGRAARMESIAGLAELKPALASLRSKGLVISLTPEGRGHVVSHALYQPGELEKIKAQYGQAAARSPTREVDHSPMREVAEPAATARQPLPQPAAPTSPPAVAMPPPSAAEPEVLQALRRDLDELRAQMAQMRSDQEDLSTQLSQACDDLQRLKDSLGA